MDLETMFYLLMADPESVNAVTPYRKSASRGWSKFVSKDIFRGKYFATATVKWSQGGIFLCHVSQYLPRGGR